MTNCESRIRSNPLSLPFIIRGGTWGLLFLILASCFAIRSAHAAIGVTPEKLEFNLKRGQTATEKLFLQNLSNEPNQLQISLATQEFKDLVSISPDEPILGAQEILEVEIMVKGRKSFETNIEIVTTPTGKEDLQILGGVKIPLLVKVEQAFNYLPLAITAGLIVISLVINMLLRKRKTFT